MKKRYTIILLITFLCFLTTLVVQAQVYEEGQLFVKLKNETSDKLLDFRQLQQHYDTSLQPYIDKLLQDYEIEDIYCPFRLKDAQLQKTYLVKFRLTNRAEELIKVFESFDFVEYAEQVPAYANFYTPNDPEYTNQWNLSKVNAAQAWDISRGNTAVVVAVVDDAVLLNHQDIAPNLWVNTGEIPGNNIDDDANGYTDDVNGYDVADNDGDPNPPATATANNFSHGTHCAGIVSATSDNSIGIASLGFSTRIMAIKTKESATSGGSLQSPYLGVEYAIAAEADIISMSWGGSSFSQTYQNLFNTAHNAGITLIAAAGNDNSSQLKYPASYGHVISVAASDLNDAKASFSNYGDSIDVTAPGVDILSCLASSTSDYGDKSGTSMACPLVSGLASLMLSYDPSLTPDRIEQCLKSTAVDIDPQNPSYVNMLGAGRIDAYAAMTCLSGPPIANFNAASLHICPGTTVQYTDVSYRTPTAWNWSFPGGTPTTSTMQNPQVTYNTGGVYDATLIVTNSLGTDTLSLSNYITVDLPSAVLSGGGFINVGANAFLQLDLIGTPPFEVIYTDGTTNYTLSGITSSPHIFAVNPSVTTTYSLISVESVQCMGTTNGTALVEVSSGCNLPRNFQKIFGGSSADIPHAIKQTPDCGYIVTGQTFSYGAGSYDGFIAKLDEYGNLLWFKTYGDALSNGFRDIEVLSDGYVAVGYTRIGVGTQFSQSYIVRTNLTGQIIWDQRFNGPNNNEPGSISDIKEEADGNFLLTGTARRFVNTGGQLMIKLNRINGNIIWQRIFGVNDPETASSGIATNDGGYLIAGQSSSSGTSGLIDGTLIKMNGSQSRLWSKNYGGSQNDMIYDVLNTDDGGYMAFGTTVSFGVGREDLWLMKLNSSGVVQWSKTYGDSGNDRGRRIEKSCDGGYFLYGYTISNGNGLRDAYLVKVDSLGTLEWSKTYGGIFEEEGDGFTVTGDCGVAMAFYTYSFGEGQQDVYIIKTDSLGSTTCHDFTPATQERTVNVTTLNANATSNPTISTVAFNSTESLANPPFVENACVACGIPIADFDFSQNNNTIRFFNNSVGATDYTWYFGDGTQDSIVSPTHVYSQTGTYTVVLIAYNKCVADTFSRDIQLLGTNVCNYSIQPRAVSGKDAVVLSRSGYQDFNYASYIENRMMVWTYSGNFGIHRAYMEFDLSNICDSTPLQNATLNLFYPTNTSSTVHQGTSVGRSNNSMNFQRVTSFWLEHAITWNNQPSITTLNQVAVGQNAGTSDLSVGMTPLFQDIINNGNYGIMMRAQLEQVYRAQYYGSSDHPDDDDHPQLILDFAPINIVLDNDVLICKGDSVQLNVAGYENPNQTTGPDDAVAYLWRPADGLSCADCPNPIASPESTTTYIVSVFNCADCADADSITVYVSQVNLDLDQQVICGEDSIQLFAQLPDSINAQYIWTPIDGLSNPSIANPKASPSQQTTYFVSVVDRNGCSSTDSIEVYRADIPVIDTLEDISVCQSGGDTLELAPRLQSVSNNDYLWSPSLGLSDIYAPNPLVFLDSLGTGTHIYHLIVTNQDNCTDTGTVVITIGALNINVTTNEPLCNGDLSGRIQLNPNGATIPITYNWGQAGLSGDDVQNLGAGIYTVTVTDAIGCESNLSLTINEPTALSFNADSTQVDCNGASTGSLLVTPSGGTSPYSYNWSNLVTDSLNTGLNAGTYTVTVTDVNNCQSINTFNLGEPAALVFNADSTQVDCNGASTGSLLVTPSGGTSPYSYNWSNLVTDSLNTGLNAGTYTVTITDANNCQNISTFNLGEPTAYNNTISSNDINCHGANNGSISINTTGATPPYNYTWSQAGISGNAPNNLSAGTYMVTISDDNNCTDMLSFTIAEPDSLIFNLSSTDIACFGGFSGSISSNVIGGLMPYTYSWSNNSTTDNIINLTAGTYTLTLTDNNACTAVESITINEPTPITTNISTNNASCANDSTSSIILTPTGGTGAYTYQWSINGLTDSIATNLSAGTYTVTTTDNNNCTKLDTILISASSNIELAIITQLDASCIAICNGSIEIDAVNGTPPYTYQWSNNANNSILTNLCAGTYDATVTDANACTDTISIDIQAGTFDIDIAANPSTNIVLGESVDLSTLGVADTYNWSPASTLSSTNTSLTTATPTETTSYTLIATNVDGCIDTAVIEIEVSIPQTSVVLTLPNAFSPNGDNLNDQFKIIHEGAVELYEFRIYNRWGESVFFTDDINKGWDGTYNGTLQPSDVFIYLVKAKNLDTNEDIILHGDVALIK